MMCMKAFFSGYLSFGFSCILLLHALRESGLRIFVEQSVGSFDAAIVKPLLETAFIFC